jgi:hypothetical protein
MADTPRLECASYSVAYCDGARAPRVRLSGRAQTAANQIFEFTIADALADEPPAAWVRFADAVRAGRAPRAGSAAQVDAAALRLPSSNMRIGLPFAAVVLWWWDCQDGGALGPPLVRYEFPAEAAAPFFGAAVEIFRGVPARSAAGALVLRGYGAHIAGGLDELHLSLDYAAVWGGRALECVVEGVLFNHALDDWKQFAGALRAGRDASMLSVGDLGTLDIASTRGELAFAYSGVCKFAVSAAAAAAFFDDVVACIEGARQAIRAAAE